ncbi:uncharacterized protein EDB91DRAFT_1250068 [Suillus paluster]|uniref:uncharacterized protein n=1 Tax=Suillus paluster TaxID=48578 RepID=UPI001B871E0F|nr:uncharacterized protein EDB91DRAFT_1250068 [Suillus paluster]KAG1736447.1 hypothetical protein EDB91DRAFT_1250068 [Suillus paluster]
MSATNGLGFGISLRASSLSIDAWGAMASASRSTSHLPDPWTSPLSQISCALSPQPHRSIAPAFSPTSSARSTPVSSPQPLPNTADSTQPTNMAGLSKEKAAEMARRKERHLIEQLTEQKKNAAATGKA